MFVLILFENAQKGIFVCHFALKKAKMNAKAELDGEQYSS